MGVCSLICVPASRRRARGLPPRLVPSRGHAALIPDASGPLGLRAALALRGNG